MDDTNHADWTWETPTQPSAFRLVGLALANVTDWFGTSTQQFNGIGQTAQAINAVDSPPTGGSSSGGSVSSNSGSGSDG